MDVTFTALDLPADHAALMQFMLSNEFPSTSTPDRPARILSRRSLREHSAAPITRASGSNQNPKGAWALFSLTTSLTTHRCSTCGYPPLRIYQGGSLS